MKRLFLMFFIAVAFAACGDGGADRTGTGADTTEMNQPAPDTSMRSDTSTMDTARNMDQ